MIPKLHAMSHYVGLIKALGPAAHYSTNQSERMHIQAAKVPYRRSNRRNFMLQIINRLDLSERMREQDEYFRWRKMVESLLQDNGSDREADSDEELEVGAEESDGDELDEPQEAGLQEQNEGDDQQTESYEAEAGETHTYPARPYRSQVSVAQVARERGMPDLYRQLQLYYLRSAGGAAAHRRVVGYELEPLPFTCIDLYKQFRVILPAPPYEPKSGIRLTVKADPQGGKARQRRKSYFSTVLIDEKGDSETALKNGLKG